MSLDNDAPTEKVCVQIRGDKIRASFAADHKGSRTQAIANFCIDCVGFDPGYRKDISECQSFDCFLWPYRPYQKGQVRPVGSVPTKEEYQKSIKANQSPARVAQGKRLGNMKKKPHIEK